MYRILNINRNVRSIRRYRQIITVMGGYGLGQLLEYLNLGHVVALSRRMLRRPNKAANLSAPERLRLALEELGPTFIKLGQLLSTRADIIPPAFVQELARLQDEIPCIDFEEIKVQIEHELGVPLESRFLHVDQVAIAGASIAQVHRATLITGEDVVVKVRRPGVIEAVETDIDILMGVALLLERHMARSDIYDPVGVVREFSYTIRREMDLSREGHAIERIRDNFKGGPDLYFPQVYWEATAKGVLTTEYVDGIKVSDICAIEKAGLDRREIARRGATAFLKMVLEHGFFHGDPHPGNVMILPNNVICLLDYGMVGRLDPAVKRYLTDVLGAVIHRDVEGLAYIVAEAGDAGENVNMHALKKGLAEFIDSYFEIPLKEIVVGRMLLEFIDLISTHRIKVHPDLTMLVKVLVVVEGMGRKLDPDFDMVGHLRPFLEREYREQRSPGRLLREMEQGLEGYLTLARNLPRELKEILNKINRNKFRIDLEHRGLDRFSRELDRSANRVCLSLIIAALLIGSSIAMQTNHGPMLWGLPVFAFFGYSCAGVVGIWWMIAILRSGRL
ncbi:quinone biosynthesis kinase AarF, putative [Citrifermentans bemidjiense Bem]|uniref:Quinone biosynthesis kinase AarF, putative n=1 Tax=Citrifermentans bemidjiense (strain ATCC BAA-1014 / DSM 16622 / JCM 12645 / Bem) TaxID=404380 RepID=B5EFL9_CITBB|nr:AarF/UbiB family protein [Citrifermentans bemidjiense]ACH37923.1 quinone biosynthesis kinase AarF, putative [Citrifermentans bemidjiense Bem]